MTNPQLLQPQHSQSIRSSALKSNKNVCTADKLGFVLDTSTHTLELSEAFTELLTEAAKHPIRTQNDLLEAAASELDRNLLDHALTAHDSPFEYVRFKTGNQVSWTRIALQTRITLKAKHSLTDLLLGMTPDKSSMICFRPHHLLDRCFARCRNSFCFHSNTPYFLPRSEPKRQ